MMGRWHYRAFFACLTVLLAGSRVLAQRYDTASIFNIPLQLDTFVVHSGFDVAAFIKRVRTDTTFYKAFKNMRFVPYDAVNNIEVLDGDGQITAAQYSKTRQYRSRRCRVTRNLEQRTTGNYLDRKGNYNYYTSSLFAYLFLAADSVCGESDVIAGRGREYGAGQMEKRKYELKQLIFNPGAKVSGIPFMSDRASIFDRDEAEKYDFRIERADIDGTPAYMFRITPRAGYERKTLYNELTTWFRRSDYSILARNYALAYHTLVYDFDVRMQVRTTQANGRLYPTFISYNGNWHIFSKKRERVRFTVQVTY